MENCIFCKIAKKEAEAQIIKETDNLIVFPDINPQAETHLLIVPKKHLIDIRDASDSLWTEIKSVILQLAKERNSQGFRIVNNAGTSAMVKHMHVHFLTGLSAEVEL